MTSKIHGKYIQDATIDATLINPAEAPVYDVTSDSLVVTKDASGITISSNLYSVDDIKGKIKDKVGGAVDILTKVLLDGPTYIKGNGTYTFTITNYSNLTNYTLSTSNGTISRQGNTITWKTDGLANGTTKSFTINGRVISFTINDDVNTVHDSDPVEILDIKNKFGISNYIGNGASITTANTLVNITLNKDILNLDLSGTSPVDSNGHTFSVLGSASLVTFNGKRVISIPNTSSGYTSPASQWSAFNYSQTQFAIDFNYYASTFSLSQLLTTWGNFGSTGGWVLVLNANGTVSWYSSARNNGAGPLFTSTSNLVANQWNHISMKRYNNALYFQINDGPLESAYNYPVGTTENTGTNFSIGSSYSGGNSNAGGYFADISIGSYTATLTQLKFNVDKCTKLLSNPVNLNAWSTLHDNDSGYDFIKVTNTNTISGATGAKYLDYTTSKGVLGLKGLSSQTFANNDFSIEFSVNIVAGQVNKYLLGSWTNSNLCYIDTSGYLAFYVSTYSTSGPMFTSSAKINDGNWHNVKIARILVSSTYVYSIFIDGILSNIFTTTTAYNINTSTWYIDYNNSSVDPTSVIADNSGQCNMKLSALRVSNGESRFDYKTATTSSYILDDNTISLFDGTSLNDLVGYNTWTKNGGVTVDPNGNGLYFDGVTQSRLNAPANFMSTAQDFELSMDFKVDPTTSSSASAGILFSKRNISDGSGYFECGYTVSTKQLWFVPVTNVVVNIATILWDVWYTLTIKRINGKVFVYLNGTLTNIHTSDFIFDTKTVTLGGDYGNPSLKGWIKGFKITSLDPNYALNYTPTYTLTSDTYSLFDGASLTDKAPFGDSLQWTNDGVTLDGTNGMYFNGVSTTKLTSKYMFNVPRDFMMSITFKCQDTTSGHMWGKRANDTSFNQLYVQYNSSTGKMDLLHRIYSPSSEVTVDSVNVGEWNTITYKSIGNVLYVYLNGAMKYKGTNFNYNTTTSFQLGSSHVYTSFKGWIKGFEIVWLNTWNTYEHNVVNNPTNASTVLPETKYLVNFENGDLSKDVSNKVLYPSDVAYLGRLNYRNSSTTLPLATSGSVAKVYNNRLYVISGNSFINITGYSITSLDLSVFDINPTTGALTLIPSISSQTASNSGWEYTGMKYMQSVRQQHSVEIVNGKMYVFGGYRSCFSNGNGNPQTQWSTLIEVYNINPTTGELSFNSALSTLNITKICASFSSFVIGNRIYLIYGNQGNTSDLTHFMEVYDVDPTTGALTKNANFTTLNVPVSTISPFSTNAIVYNNRVYYFVLNYAYVLIYDVDPTTGALTYNSTLTNACPKSTYSGSPRICSNDNSVYLININIVGAIDSFIIDKNSGAISKNTVTSLSSRSGSSLGNGTASVIDNNNHMYLIGGLQPTQYGAPTNTIDFFDIVNNPNYSLSKTVSKYGNNSIHFDGTTTSYLDVPVTFDTTKNSTIKFWMKAETLANHCMCTLLNSSNTSLGEAHWWSDNTAYLSGMNATKTSITLDNTNWHLIALRYDTLNKNFTLYIDGKYIISSDVSAKWSTVTKIRFGTALATYSFKGWMDEIEIIEEPITIPDAYKVKYYPTKYDLVNDPYKSKTIFASNFENMIEVPNAPLYTGSIDARDSSKGKIISLEPSNVFSERYSWIRSNVYSTDGSDGFSVGTNNSGVIVSTQLGGITATNYLSQMKNCFNTLGLNTVVHNNGRNVSGTSYKSFTFKESANFFRIVKYTGDGIAGRKIEHDLQSKPGMIWVFCTQGNTTGQPMWHKSMKTNTTVRHSTAQDPYVFNTTYTYSTLYFRSVDEQYVEVTDNVDINKAGNEYYMMIFGDDGLDISCGLYMGDGTTGHLKQAINTGWTPQYVYLVNMSSTAYPIQFDLTDMNPLGNGLSNPKWWYANNVEGRSTGYEPGFRMSATGMTVSNESLVAGYSPNIANNYYIYMAIRKPS